LAMLIGLTKWGAYFIVIQKRHDCYFHLVKNYTQSSILSVCDN